MSGISQQNVLARMDPADSGVGHLKRPRLDSDPQMEEIQRTLASLGAHTAAQDQLLTQVLSILKDMNATGVTQPGAAAPGVLTPDPGVPAPARSSRGEARLGECRGFIMVCDQVFSTHPSTYHSDPERIAYITANLGGKALAWATALWDSQHSARYSYHAFITEFRCTFDLSVDETQSSAC